MQMTRRLVLLAVLGLTLWPAAVFGQDLNALTAQERAQGWKLLFDGRTLSS